MNEDDNENPTLPGPSRREQAREIGAWAGMTLTQLFFYLLLLIAIGVVLGNK